MKMEIRRDLTDPLKMMNFINFLQSEYINLIKRDNNIAPVAMLFYFANGNPEVKMFDLEGTMLSVRNKIVTSYYLKETTLSLKAFAYILASRVWYSEVGYEEDCVDPQDRQEKIMLHLEHSSLGKTTWLSDVIRVNGNVVSAEPFQTSKSPTQGRFFDYLPIGE